MKGTTPKRAFNRAVVLEEVAASNHRFEGYTRIERQRLAEAARTVARLNAPVRRG